MKLNCYKLKKYNTENSSSSAIRIWHQIQKWNRLSIQKIKTGKYNPVLN